MDLLKKRIMKESDIVSDKILNVDSILNQQVDPKLMMQLGHEFAKRFANEQIDKILTIEASGISVAFAVAHELGVPLVFARRKRPLTGEDVLVERVPSFTKGIVTDIVVSKRFLTSGERVLVIDDIIANGDAVRGLIKIIERAEAELVGFGVVIEKSFQAGGDSLRKRGIRVEPLVQIKSLENGQIILD